MIMIGNTLGIIEISPAIGLRSTNIITTAINTVAHMMLSLRLTSNCRCVL